MHPDVELKGVDFNNDLTDVKDILPGFFTGSIGEFKGLFFRSNCDITYLGPNYADYPTISPEIKFHYWGYSFSISAAIVKNYRPVKVTIEVKN